jgi:predicted O-methyltransferase YrrM
MNNLLTVPNEWQQIDPKTKLLYAWYTDTFIEELKKWKIKNWDVLEIGSGASTLWWGKNVKSLDSYEDNQEWFDIVKEGIDELKLKVNYNYTNNYLDALKTDKKYDCIIIDGGHRDLIIKTLIENIHLFKKGGILILDNLEFIPTIMELDYLRTNKMFVYPQTNHYFWRTAYWKLENFERLTDNHEYNSFKQKERRCQ